MEASLTEAQLKTRNENIVRFFKIAIKLPQELQMILSLRAVGLSTQFIKASYLQESFKKMLEAP